MTEEQEARLAAAPAHAPVSSSRARPLGGIAGATRARLARALDAALRCLAVALAVSLVVAGWHDVSQGYDIWYYHLPFAARIVGIMDASTYAFSADNAVRYQGFPLLTEALQGLVWRVTGHIEATSFVSLAALFAIPIFLRRVFGAPLHLSLLALLAIPLVHIHATSSYVDLPGNACATMLLLCVYRLTTGAGVRRGGEASEDGPTGRAPSLRFLAGCAVLAAAAANMRFQVVPIVAIASAVLAFCSLRGLRSWRRLDRPARSALAKRALVIAVAAPVVLATPIKNTILHGNPVWPVELRVLGRALPYAEEAYSQSPPHLVNAPRPYRFVRSALEVDNVPISTGRRWSLDQWAPPDHPSSRMGGYFGAYVAVNLLALGWAAWRRRTRETIGAAVLFGGVTVVASLVPQSHELRYYMHWMLLLVSLNVILWAREARAIVGVVAVAALSVVVWATSAGYIHPSGSTFDQFLAKRADRRVVESAAPGERLCISREPFTFLYAPAFHGRDDYAVQEATSDADCKDARRVP